MSIEKFNFRNGVLALFILGAAATRLVHLGEVSQWANFSPLGAMSLFGGVYFSDKRKAFAVPLITMAISDVFIYYSYFGKVVFFYDGAFWVYLSFALMVLLGTYIKKVNFRNIALASLATVVIHWLVSDIEPWLYGNIYPKTFSGYIQCLIMAIPYEKNLLLGNAVFGLLMFGGFELAKSKFWFLRTEKDLLY